MLKKFLALFLVALFACSVMASCNTMGRATGEAVKGIKNAGDDFEQGYEEGSQ